MAVIGHFRQSRSGGWEGRVRTLSLNVALRLEPNDERTHPKAPAFRAMIGRSHVGDAWEHTRRTDPPRPMLRVLLDDPLLPASIDAALLPDESGESAVLIWSRQEPLDPLAENSRGRVCPAGAHPRHASGWRQSAVNRWISGPVRLRAESSS
jgi:uncharacterized protein (DUF736 family)